MDKPLVLCRCGHLVLGKEVLRTDLYERSSGHEYVYVKFRCARCKRIAQTFVPASAWDWRKLEPAPGELSSEERDRLLEEEPVQASDLLSFHEEMALIETSAQLAQALHLDELAAPDFSVEPASEPTRPRRRRTRGRRERDDKRASAGASAGKDGKEKGGRGKKDKPERSGEAPQEAPQNPREEGLL